MEKIRTLVSQHKKTSLLTPFAFIVPIGFSTTGAMSVVCQRAAEEVAKTESVDEQGTSDDKKGVEEKVKLSSSQRKLIDEYDDETKKFIGTSSTSVFPANNGRNTLRFHDDYYAETVNGKKQGHFYAISTVKFGDNGSDSEADRVVFETDTGTHIATFTLAISVDNASAGECTTASTPMFKLTDMPYGHEDAVKEVNVTGLSNEITELPSDIDEVKERLSDWCSIHFPVATTAMQIGTCNIDYDEDIISTAFAISDGNSNGAAGNTGASVSVAYNRSEKKYSFLMQAISSGRKVRRLI